MGSFLNACKGRVCSNKFSAVRLVGKGLGENRPQDLAGVIDRQQSNELHNGLVKFLARNMSERAGESSPVD